MGRTKTEGLHGTLERLGVRVAEAELVYNDARRTT